jgi:hypothetical protein
MLLVSLISWNCNEVVQSSEIFHDGADFWSRLLALNRGDRSSEWCYKGFDVVHLLTPFLVVAKLKKAGAFALASAPDERYSSASYAAAVTYLFIPVPSSVVPIFDPGCWFWIIVIALSIDVTAGFK